MTEVIANASSGLCIATAKNVPKPARPNQAPWLASAITLLANATPSTIVWSANPKNIPAQLNLFFAFGP